MRPLKQSEAPGWKNNPSGRPYGLPYFIGNKVSVTFGRLEPSFWYEHSFNRVRLLFALGRPYGSIEITTPGNYRYPAQCLGPDELWIIPPKLETTLDWVRRAELVVLYVNVPGYNMDREPLSSDVIIRDLRSLGRRDPLICQLGQMFLALCRQSHPPEPEFVEGLGIELACRTLRACHSSDEVAPPPRAGLPVDLVSQLTEYVDGHLSERILVTHLAGHAGLSPDHFARRFKITTEMSPRQFVLTRRVEKVRELLRTGRYNVTEAGREVGFHDLSHLNRCFRSIYGCSPKKALNSVLASDSPL